jgi:hypothetical protein
MKNKNKKLKKRKNKNNVKTRLHAMTLSKLVFMRTMQLLRNSKKTFNKFLEVGFQSC